MEVTTTCPGQGGIPKALAFEVTGTSTSPWNWQPPSHQVQLPRRLRSFCLSGKGKQTGPASSICPPSSGGVLWFPAFRRLLLCAHALQAGLQGPVQSGILSVITGTRQHDRKDRRPICVQTATSRVWNRYNLDIKLLELPALELLNCHPRAELIQRFSGCLHWVCFRRYYGWSWLNPSGGTKEEAFLGLSTLGLFLTVLWHKLMVDG